MSTELQWATILMLVLLPAAIVIARHLSRGRALEGGSHKSAVNSEGYRRLRTALFWFSIVLVTVVALFTVFLLFPGGLWSVFWPSAVLLWILGIGASIYLLYESLLRPRPRFPRVVAFFLALPLVVCVIPSVHMGAEPGESAASLYFLFSLAYVSLVLLSWLLAALAGWIVKGFSFGTERGA